MNDTRSGFGILALCTATFMLSMFPLDVAMAQTVDPVDEALFGYYPPRIHSRGMTAIESSFFGADAHYASAAEEEEQRLIALREKAKTVLADVNEFLKVLNHVRQDVELHGVPTEWNALQERYLSIAGNYEDLKVGFGGVSLMALVSDDMRLGALNLNLDQNWYEAKARYLALRKRVAQWRQR